MNERIQIIQCLTQEERELLCFSEPMVYHIRLQQYLEHPQGFATKTTLAERNINLSTTKTFRCYLHRFIRNFQPKPLLPGSKLWLHLDKSGRFYLRLGSHGDEINDFSESDFYIFQYLCFLHIRHFWDYVRKHCCFPDASLPILIRDFSHLFESNTDYAALLKLSRQVTSQVIIL